MIKWDMDVYYEGPDPDALGVPGEWEAAYIGMGSCPYNAANDAYDLALDFEAPAAVRDAILNWIDNYNDRDVEYETETPLDGPVFYAVLRMKTVELTEEMQEHVMAGYMFCPLCGGDTDVSWDMVDTPTFEVLNTCASCGNEWVTIYGIVGARESVGW